MPRKPTDHINYLLKDLPEFNLIVDLYKKLYLKAPALSEVREIQAIRNEAAKSNVPAS